MTRLRELMIEELRRRKLRRDNHPFLCPWCRALQPVLPSPSRSAWPGTYSASGTESKSPKTICGDNIAEERRPQDGTKDWD